jgi:hypothetical protein
VWLPAGRCASSIIVTAIVEIPGAPDNRDVGRMRKCFSPLPD